MRTKFVIRILDEQGEMMGWQEVMAEAPGDGTLVTRGDTFIPMDRAGIPTIISYHWADINVETKVAVNPEKVRFEPGMNVHFGPTKLITIGPAAGGLPPVTTRGNTSIAVPAGNMAAIGLR